MAEISKPDFTYLWSSGGSLVAPSNTKIQTGWTAEVPPYQWENWSQNRQDQAISHILQKGISVWSLTGEYYFTASGERSYVQGSDGSIYVAVADSVGQNPVTDTTATYWKLAFRDSTGPSVVGEMRRGRMYVTVPTQTSTYTAQEVVVKTALGGASHIIGNYSKVINLGTTGAGGMDTGTAPVNGYVGLYAIYNTITADASIIAVNAATLLSPVYAGVNMPAGYNASALLTVVPTNASGQFKNLFVQDRKVTFTLATAFTGSTVVTFLPVSIAASVPANATEIFGELSTSNGTVSSMSLAVVGDTNSVGQQVQSVSGAAGATSVSNYAHVPLPVPQTFYISTLNSAGSPTFTVYIGGYFV